MPRVTRHTNPDETLSIELPDFADGWFAFLEVELIRSFGLHRIDGGMLGWDGLEAKLQGPRGRLHLRRTRWYGLELVAESPEDNPLVEDIARHILSLPFQFGRPPAFPDKIRSFLRHRLSRRRMPV